MKLCLRDWSLSAVAAGFLAVLVSYAGPLAIFCQAAQVARVSDEMCASWVWAISIGAAVSGVLLSSMLKAPVITAWSAPGTALLITLFPALTLPEAVGTYLTAAALILLIIALLAIACFGSITIAIAAITAAIRTGPERMKILPGTTSPALQMAFSI